MAPMFPLVPQAQVDMPISSYGNVAWPHTPMHIHSPPPMTAYPTLQSTVLSEKSDNYLPPSRFTPVNLQKENITNKPVTTKSEDITVVSENDDVHVDDQMDIVSNTDAEHADTTMPAQKRKRMTNNSLNHDLDAGISDLDIRPPSKRMHRSSFGREHTFSPGYAHPDGNLTDTELPSPSAGIKFTPLDREKGVLIGIWKDSPSQDLSRRHAVWGFLDAGGAIRRKIMPETRDGERIEEGNPVGTGRSFISPDSIIPEPHISSLTTPELKEYIRIRSEPKSQSELPEERRKAEAAAVLGAKMAAASNLPVATPIPTATATPRRPSSTPVHVSAPNFPKTQPKGFLVGYWKFSDALDDADKHAIYSVVDGDLNGPIDSVRLRVKIAQLTRDQRNYRGNFPTKPGSAWVPYESIILEPALAGLNRLELTEYVRIRNIETAEGKSVLGNWLIDYDAIERAKANLAAEAAASGYDPAQRNAEAETRRTSQYKLKMAAREKEHKSQRSSKQSPKAMPPTAYVHTPSSRAEGCSGAAFWGSADSELAETMTVRSATPTSTANQKSDAKTTGGPTAPVREIKVEREVEKPMAKRSNKAEASARQEKLWKKQTRDIVREKGQLKEQAQKSGIASRRLHNLQEPYDARSSGLANDKHRSNERAARTFDKPERQSKELLRQDVPREHAEMRETVSRETKMIGRKRLEKVPRAQGTERVDSEARANARRTDDGINSGEQRRAEEDKKAGEIIRSEDKEKAAEMKKAEEEKAKDEREQVEQELLAEGLRRRLEEQKKSGEQKRTGERALAEKRQESKEMQNALSKSQAEESEKVKSGEKEKEPERHRPDTAEREIPLASPARAIQPPGNALLFEAPPPTPGVKRHNDVVYERRNGGAFAGKLVGDKRELITIDGEDYVEYRILMRTEF